MFSTAGHGSDEPPQMVVLYDEILNGPLADFVSLCSKIGGDVDKLVSKKFAFLFSHS